MSEKIKNILITHCGKENAIASKRISEEMGFPMEPLTIITKSG